MRTILKINIEYADSYRQTDCPIYAILSVVDLVMYQGKMCKIGDRVAPGIYQYNWEYRLVDEKK